MMYVFFFNRRPVKVIRLIGRDTVEEIVLRRAEAKLKLTHSVIEGGQFSLASKEDNSLIADGSMQVIICKIGKVSPKVILLQP